MNILSISTSDQSGGAERVALDLHRGYLSAGLNARLVVKWQRTRERGVYPLRRFSNNSVWSRWLAALARVVKQRHYFRGQFTLQDWLADLAMPRRGWDKIRGCDNYFNPLCGELLSWEDGWRPDIIHVHNLHGGYFDLAELPRLNETVPIVATLHDTWLFTGHCGYFVDCNHWQQGCGNCPDLKRYPAISRDRTAKNAAAKRHWMNACRQLHLITPSQWLQDLITDAQLPCASRSRIPYGIDLTTFKPAQEPKRELRRQMSLPDDRFIVLGVAGSLTKSNAYKDAHTLLLMCENLVAMKEPRFHCVLLGASDLDHARENISFTGYVRDPAVVANYYQAADVFVHTARADNYPCTVLEAQACGTPVIATGVGGIPEQIVNGETGILVERENVGEITNRLLELVAMPDRLEWGRRAAKHARANFDLSTQVARYLTLLSSIIP